MVMTGFCSFTALFHNNSNDWTKKFIPLPGLEQRVRTTIGFLLSSGKPTDGEARQSGNCAVAAEVTLSSRWASIFWITGGSSILAIIRTSPPHSLQVSTSILNTRFNRLAQVIDARCSAGVWSCVSSGVGVFLPFPRLAGVTRARYLLWGANTP